MSRFNNRMPFRPASRGNQMPGSMDPKQIMQSIMNDPRYANNKRAQAVFECYRNGDIEGIRKIGSNIAAENGTTFENEQKKFFGSLSK